MIDIQLIMCKLGNLEKLTIALDALQLKKSGKASNTTDAKTSRKGFEYYF